MDAATNSLVFHTLTPDSDDVWDTPPSPQGFVESYADQLMDDLFDDVERLLDSTSQRSTDALAEPEFALPPRPPIPSPMPPRLSMPLPQQPHPESAEFDAEEEDGLEDTCSDDAIVLRQAAQPQPSVRLYDRLLLVVGCASAITALALWFLSHDAWRTLFTLTSSAPRPMPQVFLPEPEIKPDPFADYVMRSLQAIDQRNHASSTASATTSTKPGLVQVPGKPTINGNGSLPVVTVPKTSTQVPQPAIVRPSPIYVPIYKMPTGLFNPGTAVSPLPNSGLTQPSLLPNPSPLAMLNRTLVGVMELGKDSAALIEINGVTQRYRIGESIGSTGWNVVEVSKNQVIIRRNGEVRSIFVGQGF
jgi:hypothetical protein